MRCEASASCETVSRATSAGAGLYGGGVQALVHRWRKCVANGADYVEK